MKKIIIAFGIILTCTSSAWWILHEESANKNENIIISEIINNDYYAAGKNIEINSEINGDVVIAGQEISINQGIREDLIVAGKQLDIAGSIGDDARIAGKKITVSNDIGDDLIIRGKKVTVTDDSLIKGDINIMTKSLDFSGLVLGNGELSSKTLIFKGVIDGDVTISTKKILEVHPQSQIRGNLTLNVPSNISKESVENLRKIVKGDFNPVYKNSWSFITCYLYKFLFLFIFGSLLYFAFEGFYRETATIMRQKHWKSFLVGILYLTSLLLGALLMFISFIGIPIGILLLLGFTITICLFELITLPIFTGFTINKYFRKEKKRSKKFMVIATIALLLTIIPGIDFILAIFALGALTMHKTDVLKKIMGK